MRHGIAFTLVFALTALVFATTTASGAERTSCPNGYFGLAVPQDEAAMRLLPRIDAGLDADPPPYTVDDLLEVGNLIDENGDGDFCLKAVSNLRGSSDKHWGFFYLARDNDSAAS